LLGFSGWGLMLKQMAKAQGWGGVLERFLLLKWWAALEGGVLGWGVVYLEQRKIRRSLACLTCEFIRIPENSYRYFAMKIA
jgi:hypothetical protein